MTIAICISGQIRQEAFYLPKLARFVKDMDAQVFISVWANKGTKTSGALNLAQLVRVFGSTALRALPLMARENDAFQRVFPKFSDILEADYASELAPVDREFLLGFFPNAVIDIEDEHLLDFKFRYDNTSDANSIKMLYKIWRCNQMKRAFEIKSGARFDIVFRARPDIVPNPVSDQQREAVASTTRPTIFVNGAYPTAVGDALAISTSENADKYAALLGKALVAPERQWRGIHQEMQAHLAETGATLENASPHYGLGIAADSNDHARAVGALRKAVGAAGDTDWRWFATMLDTAELLQKDDFRAESDRFLALADDVASGRISDPAFTGAAFDILLDFAFRSGDHASALALFRLGCIARARYKPPAKWVALNADTILRDNLKFALLSSYFANADMSAPIDDMTRVIANGDCASAAGYVAAISETMDGATPEEAAAVAGFFAGSDKSFLQMPLSEIGREALRTDNPELGRAAAELLIRIAPNDWGGHDLRGHCCARLGLYEDALHSAKQALALSEGNGGLHCRVGFVLMYHLGRAKEAVPYFDRGRELWPDERAHKWYEEAVARGSQQG